MSQQGLPFVCFDVMHSGECLLSSSSLPSFPFFSSLLLLLLLHSYIYLESVFCGSSTTPPASRGKRRGSVHVNSLYSLLFFSRDYDSRTGVFFFNS